MNNPSEDSSRDQPRLAYRSREAADKLSISLSSLERLTKQGEIPVSRVGRLKLYSHELLVKWLNSKSQ